MISAPDRTDVSSKATLAHPLLPFPVDLELAELTPELAAEFLLRNRNNRTIKERAIDRYMRDILADAFRFTGQPLIFDADHWMLNGQHLCTSVVRSKKSAGVVLIVRGVPPETVHNLDSGVKRSLSDTLAFHGSRDAQVPTTLGLYDKWERGIFETSSWRAFTLTSEEVLKRYKDIGDLAVEAVKLAYKIANDADVKLNVAIIATFYLRAQRNHGWDAENLRAFLRNIVSGAGLPDGSPILAYRRGLMLGRKRRVAKDQRDHLALFVMAFNYWVERKEVQYLKWNASKSVFPEIVKPKA